MNPLKLLGFSFLLFFLSGCTEAGFELLLHLEAREVKNKAIEKREECGYTDSSGNTDPLRNGKYCFLFHTAAIVTDHCLTIRKKEPILQEDCENLLWRIVMKPDSFFVKNPAGPLRSSDAHEDIDRFFLANKDDDSDPLVKFIEHVTATSGGRESLLVSIMDDPALAAGVRHSDLRIANPANEADIGNRTGASKLWFIQNKLFQRAPHKHEKLADFAATKNYIFGNARQRAELADFIGGSLRVAFPRPDNRFSDPYTYSDKASGLKWIEDLIVNRCYKLYDTGGKGKLWAGGGTLLEAACHIKIYCEIGLAERELDQLATLDLFFRGSIHSLLRSRRPSSSPPSWWPARPEEPSPPEGSAYEQYESALDQYDRDIKSLDVLWRDNNEAPANDHLCGIDSVFSGL